MERLRVQLPAASEQKPREAADRTRFPMQPPCHEDFSRLQDLLSQALRREADAHRKMKHLYEQLLEARSPRTRSLSDGSQSATPDILSVWDDSELSQTSEGSPLSPLAVIVVSGSPALERKSLPSTPRPQMSDHHAPASGNDGQHFPGQLLQELAEALPPSPEQVAMEAQARLAPSPQDYRGVRHEREKPPPSLFPLQSPVLTFPPERPASTSPPLISQPATELRAVEGKGVGDDWLTKSLDPSGRGDLSMASPDSVPDEHMEARSNSIKGKKKHKVGHRSRSNTINILPNWIRRKKGSGVASAPSSRTLQKYPVHSIEEMFSRFVSAADTSSEQDHFAMFMDHHWSEVCRESTCSADVKKYRDAVWDLFQTEAKFLTRFLQPLERVYKGFLEELHFHGVLKVADVDKIFANLSELCELSASVARDFFALFDGRSGTRIAPNKELILSFSMFGHKFNPVYQRFCVNFEKQRGFVRALEQLPDFLEYLRVCRSHASVGKNDLSALLITPMQHQCHYQLFLEKVLKYTKSKAEKELLSSAIKAFVVSLRELEANMAENKRSAEMLELQETLCWPTLSQLEPTAFIPETLSSQLSRQPCTYVLASKDRQLVCNGPLKLLENWTKNRREVVAFLFTDSLLLTQQSTQADKKGAKKECNQLTRYSVCGHPLLLAMLDIHDIPQTQSHPHLISLVERNLFQQQIGLYSLQASTNEDKAKWLSQLTQTKNIICYRNSPSFVESDV